MIGLAFASVPLYRLFCQVTGFGGTTQRAAARQAPGAVGPDDHGPLRRQHSPGSALALRAGRHATATSRSARATWPSTPRATSPTGR